MRTAVREQTELFERRAQKKGTNYWAVSGLKPEGVTPGVASHQEGAVPQHKPTLGISPGMEELSSIAYGETA